MGWVAEQSGSVDKSLLVSTGLLCCTYVETGKGEGEELVDRSVEVSRPVCLSDKILCSGRL